MENKKIDIKKIIKSLGFVLVVIFILTILIVGCVRVSKNKDNTDCSVAYASAPTYTNLPLTFEKGGDLLPYFTYITEKQALNLSFMLSNYVNSDGTIFEDSDGVYWSLSYAPVEDTFVGVFRSPFLKNDEIVVYPCSILGLSGEFLVSCNTLNLGNWLSTHSYIKNNPYQSLIDNLTADKTALQNERDNLFNEKKNFYNFNAIDYLNACLQNVYKLTYHRGDVNTATPAHSTSIGDIKNIPLVCLKKTTFSNWVSTYGENRNLSNFPAADFSITCKTVVDVKNLNLFITANPDCIIIPNGWDGYAYPDSTNNQIWYFSPTTGYVDSLMGYCDVESKYFQSLQDTNDSIHAVTSSFNFIGNVFSKIGTFLNIPLFGEFTIGGLFAIPLIFGILFFIFKLVRG